MKDSSIRWKACFGRLPGHAALGKQHSVEEEVLRRIASFEGVVVPVLRAVSANGMHEPNAPFARDFFSVESCIGM